MLVNEDHSGFVIGSVIYNQTQKDKFEISRFSGPWVNLLSESSPVQKTQSSFLELEVKEEGSNSVVMRAELKAQESPVRITVDPKTKLSTSTFGSQPKRLPLVNSFILSGNAVDY